jgi:hypothetical protein
MEGPTHRKADAPSVLSVGRRGGEFPPLSQDKLFAEYVQDQWNQFSICEVLSIPYGRVLSTVFAESESCALDEDQDSTVPYLRYIDYRCLRFFYHPVDDKFSLISGWKDPLWTNIKRMRIGLDADDHDSRAQIFGANVIDIQQKSIIQLLIDEVRAMLLITYCQVQILTKEGVSPVLHLPNCESCPMVTG